MARTISEIENQIIEKIQENEVVASKLTSDSNVSIWRQFVYAVAFCIWFLESLFEVFKGEINEEMAKQKIHSKRWYRQKALDFQYGFDLIGDTDQFDNSNATSSQIEASKIIKQADCVKLISSTGYGILRIKVATELNNELAPLSLDQLNALKFYFLRKATDAGTQLRVTTAQADLLKLEIDVYFNPLIIASDGSMLDGSDATPVKSKIIEYLKSLEFNGQLVLNKLEKAIHQIEGIEEATIIKNAASKYGDFNYDTLNINNVGLISSVRIPDSGYMKLDEQNLIINYIVNPE